MQDFAAILRTAIEKSGKTYYALAKETGIPLTTMRQFVLCENSMGLDNAQRLAAALGLELLPKPVRAPRQKQTG